MITYLWFCWINLVGFFGEILREIWNFFNKMRVIMNERASARFIAETHW